jgi:hypothetical protein
LAYHHHICDGVLVKLDVFLVNHIDMQDLTTPEGLAREPELSIAIRARHIEPSSSSATQWLCSDNPMR